MTTPARNSMATSTDTASNAIVDTATQTPFDTGFSLITFEGNIALIEVRDGIEVDEKMALSACNIINASLKGDYGLIFNRNHSYSILPKDVYQAINQQERLVALAIVTYNDISKAVAKSEKVYCNRPFNCFSEVSSAQQWLRALLN